MASIKLGQTEKELYGDLSAAPVSPESREDRIIYPTLRIQGPEELDLPDAGVITLRFKRTAESHSTDRDGKKQYTCELDITSIEKVEDEAPRSPTRRDTSTGDALDRLAAARAAEKESEGEEY